MFARRQYDHRHRLEALRMRDQEERELKRAGNKRYREIAEQRYRERLMEMERQEREKEMAGRKQLELNNQKIKEAAKKADEPVDDGKLVDAIFDFLPDSGSEAPAPSAFRVSLFFIFSHPFSSSSSLHNFSTRTCIVLKTLSTPVDFTINS